MCGSLQSACVLWIWRKKLSFLKVSYGWYTATVKGFFALLKISQTILGCRTFPGCPLSQIVFIISMDKISSVHEKRQKGKKVSGSVVSGSCFCCCWCGSLGFSKPWTPVCAGQFTAAHEWELAPLSLGSRLSVTLGRGLVTAPSRGILSISKQDGRAASTTIHLLWWKE